MKNVNAITIIGSGALASFYAGYLSKQEKPGLAYHLTVYGTWKQQVDAIRSKGLSIIEPDGTSHLYRFEITDRVDEIPLSDIVMVLVKSYQTESKLPVIDRILKPHGICISLQNGLGNAEKIAARIGPSRTIIGITYQGVRTIRQGAIEHTGVGDTIIRTDPINATPVGFIAACLNSSHIKTELSPNIDSHVWMKVAINAAINPLTALLEISNGELLEDQRLIDLMKKIIIETMTVAREFMVEIDADSLFAHLIHVCRQTTRNHSSMLQDFERGVETEIDSINGAIKHLGASRGIDVPVNRFLIEEINRKYAGGFAKATFLDSIENKFLSTV
ncbi:2-dehydropantoate 2-reductase [candidate division KSB1 bacterium]|nr:2-dehydropantoate 2-reductase [candidate division KSB1 bacterium]